MKTLSQVSIVLLLMLTLIACGGSKVPATATQSLSDVRAAIILTLTARAGSIVETVIPSPTFTPISDSPTPEASPSSIPTATTSQNTTTSASISYNVCDSSAYVSDVTIPDGTIIAPGETFVKTWMFKNNGTCKWRADYALTFVSGDDMDGSSTTIDQAVSPGEQAEISVTLTAPETLDTYTGYWRLANEDGTVFGVSVWVQVVVSDDAATITPTYTATTYTSTPTNTPTATSITAATSTPTPTTAVVTMSTYTPVPTAIPTSTSTYTPLPTAEPTLASTPIHRFRRQSRTSSQPPRRRIHRHEPIHVAIKRNVLLSRIQNHWNLFQKGENNE